MDNVRVTYTVEYIDGEYSATLVDVRKNPHGDSVLCSRVPNIYELVLLIKGVYERYNVTGSVAILHDTHTK